MSLLAISCTNCGRVYPLDKTPYKCLVCGGVFDIPQPLPYDPVKIDSSQPGIWRYRHTFGLPDGADATSLGEGNTPLVWTEVFGRKIAFKCEFTNPTGSFKDRGTTVIAGYLKSRGIKHIIEDSSGNAGASLAAYSANAKINASIYVPASASGPKLNQIDRYGAKLVPIHGSRSDVTTAVVKATASGAVYASHAYLPFNIPGYATAAYEIFEQLGKVPGAIIAPCGQGGLLLGLSKGFDAIRAKGLTTQFPRIIGVQARACAPMWVMSTAGFAALGFVTEGQTLAEGVKVKSPVRGDALLRTIKSSRGEFVAVDEEKILTGRDELAHRGFYVEPTSALVWSALEQVLDNLPDPVVVMLTGTGLKSTIY